MKTKFVFLLAALVLVAMAFLPLTHVRAQAETPPVTEPVPVVTEPSTPLLPPMTNATDVINWLIGPGLTLAVGYFMSFMTDKFAFWKKVPHDLKVVLPFVVAIGMVLLGTTLIKNFPVFLQDKQLNTVVLSLVFYLITQKQHADADKRALAKPAV